MKAQMFSEMFKWMVLSAIVAVALPDAASAAEDVAGLINNVASKQLPALPYALSAVCYVGGAFLLVRGALSLKKHAENPASEPMGKGIASLVTGGALTGIPALSGIIQKSTTLNSGTAASFASFRVTF